MKFNAKTSLGAGSGRDEGSRSKPRPSRPTMAMVAERVGVSTQTVSFALSSPGRLSPATLRKVLKAVDELGYRPNQAARSLRSRSPQALGFRLYPADRDVGGVMASYLYELSAAARKEDYGVFSYAAETYEEETQIIEETFRRNTVDCFVITCPSSDDLPLPLFLLERQIPFVVFGRPWGLPMSDCWWVDVDGAAGLEQAVNHLVDLGHRRIAYLGWEKSAGLAEDRESGWQRAMGSHGLPTRGMIVRGPDDVETGRRLAGELLDRQTPPTGIICPSDTMAIGAMRACRERGLEPGRDVGITGYDDSLGARVVTPGLTSIAQPLETAAKHTVRLLLDLLNSPDSKPEQVLLRPSLVVRESTMTLSGTGPVS
ncbi:LacI family DNA-binding transcriptional regulator [Arthrobacter sp. HS15c]|uniref:LacI family DNA-binding transcriptional regulator n=1 Tax=Arthrobacter sp. HS15c TaxID=3230279 RepID=UPI003465C3D4